MISYRDNIVFLLAKAHQRAQGALKMQLQPFDLTTMQCLFLEALWEEEGLSVGEIGRRITLDTATLAGILDRLAYRRYHQMPEELRPAWWTPYPLPEPLDKLSPKPSTLFFRSSAQGRTEGGLFTLDGVHPTTIGYGIIAQEVLNAMIPKMTPQVDFERLIQEDSLISNPPTSVQSTLELLGKGFDKVDLILHLAKRLRFQKGCL